MDGFFFADHWFALVMLALAGALGVWLLIAWQRNKTWSLAILLPASALALTGIGGLLLPGGWGLWLGLGALAVLFVMLLLVVVTSRWWAPFGYAIAAIGFLGLGGACTQALSQGLVEAGKTITRLEAMQPWWLLGLGLVPIIVLLSFRSLAGLGPVRRWVAIGLRCLGVILLVLALAEVRIRHENESVTVLFLVDRSLSIPEDWDPTTKTDFQFERIKKFINDAVATRPESRDKAGVIVFGRRPKLELPPSDTPKMNFNEVVSTVDTNYTDIASAIKLALASFPEGTAKRIVLFSDGNENLGDALEQARIAKLNGAQIDVVPIIYRNENEVMVQSVEAPAITEQSALLPIRVLLRNFHPQPVEGTLTVKEVSEGQGVELLGSPRRVVLHPGLNSVKFQRALTKQEKSYTYEAAFQPDNLPGDRVQNNRATTHVIALGRRRVLLIEPNTNPSEHQLLVDYLRRVGNSKFTVHTATPDQLPQGKAEFAAFLSSYDCVILANVPASDVAPGDVPAGRVPSAITEDQQEIIRSNTKDQGCGLIMIGGPYGFGAGGWQGTPVEQALPVDCEIKSVQVQGKGGLVLIMHASEMADGNRWQKDIAKLAIKKLSTADMMGMLYYDWSGGGHKWHIPFKDVGGSRERMLRLVDSMIPGDMPDVDPSFRMAQKELNKPSYNLATKHIIFISDGDHWNASQTLLSQMKGQKITVTTVCITSHGQAEVQKMQQVATATGGRFYNVKSPRALPAIYIKETRIISQSFVSEKRFTPKLFPRASGPTASIKDVQPLLGFVRTTLKDSPLVDMPIEGPSLPGQPFPILAYWHYGLGKSAAFTSDARSRPGRPGWDREWAGSDMYYKFWEQLVDWCVRAVETGNLVMTTEYRDGKVKISVDARDQNNKPLTDLILRGRITPPSLKADDPRQNELKFVQKNSGIYEAEFKAEESGSYFINAQAVRRVKKTTKDGKEVEVEEGVDSIRSGVTIPYSPEFSEMESNAPLMKKLAEMTGGREFLEKPRQRINDQVYPDYATVPDGTKTLSEAAASGLAFRREGLPPAKSFQPIWYWLLVLAGVLLLFDVAIRRIALNAAEVATAAQKGWERLRGRAVRADETPQFLERLKSRKAQISETIGKEKAARRFEGEPVLTGTPLPGADEGPAAPSRPAARPTSQPRIAPEKEHEAADYASRLMKAKKRVWEEREKDKGSQ